ncbi:MAG: sulfatase-like hydrolase/transferase [Lachnospiraceae bacterium]|nr:sulfatase-like hydrolase/transferase [Lachnospiraceae bacterium]
MYSITIILCICATLAVGYSSWDKEVSNKRKKQICYLLIAMVASLSLTAADFLFSEKGETPNYIIWIFLLIYSDHILYRTVFLGESKKQYVYSLFCMALMVFMFYNISEGNICTESAGIKNIIYGKLSKGSIQFIIIFLLLLPPMLKRILSGFRKFRGLLDGLLYLFVPFAMFYACELAYNPKVFDIELKWVGINIFICLLMELGLCLLPISRKKILNIILIGSFLFGVVNYFLIEFRGCPFISIDIASISTAATVAGGYEYVLSDSLVKSILFTVFASVIINTVCDRGKLSSKEMRSRLMIRITAFSALMGVMIIFIGFSNLDSFFDMNTDLYYPSSTYIDKGAGISFLAIYQLTRVSKPDDYDEEKVMAMLQRSSGKFAYKVDKDMKPSIIVIMNESFSDLSVLGQFEKTKEHLDFFYSLYDDGGTIQIGNAYVSTRGGNTAKSEFEFLTGNTMAFLSGIIPYTVYHFDNIYSIPREMVKQSYGSIAMHPDTPNNWARKRVYSEMGFNKFISIEGFEGYETLRDFVSDEGDYERVLDEYASHEEPVFIFNITEQNHGGYATWQFENKDIIVDVDEDYKDFDNVIAYESLIKQTDEANRRLIQELKRSSKPVIVCFFGDHQPVLGSEFDDRIMSNDNKRYTKEVENNEKIYIVPYFIWANFEPERTVNEYKLDGKDVTSINYLMFMIQYYAGLDISDYGKYLLSLRDDIPVINSEGYLTSDKKWHSFEEVGDAAKLVNEYKNVQYFEMFGR